MIAFRRFMAFLFAVAISFIVVGAVLLPMLLTARDAVPGAAVFRLSLETVRHAVTDSTPAGRTALLLRRSLNSLAVSACVAVLCALIAPGIAYALGFRRLPLRRAWFGLLIVMAIAPVTLVLVPAELVIKAGGIRPSLLTVGVLDLAAAMPASIWILIVAVRRIPTDLLDAARLEGLTPEQTYRSVILPLLRPARWVAAGAAFAIVWSEYVASSLFLARSAEQTLAASVIGSLRVGAEPWHPMAFTLVLAAIPALASLAPLLWDAERWLGLDWVIDRLAHEPR
jgi:ABC-type glycerol-3-phosphate transport system permease component